MKPIVIVAGLARCGTSLMMQILDSAGIPCDGRYPDFEGPLASSALKGDFAGDWLEAWRGYAFKFLDPQRVAGRWLPIIPADAIIFWMRRNPREQAASQVKLLRGHGAVVDARSARRAGEKSLVRDTTSALAGLRMTGATVHEISFEGLISRPDDITEGICKILAPSFGGLDAAKMRRCIIPRPVGCLPDRELEAELVRRGRP